MTGSTRRSRPSAHRTPIVRAESGRALCRFCGDETRPPRQTFCSDACVDEWKIRTSPAFARRKVLERDNAICALCGVDTRPDTLPNGKAFYSERQRLRAAVWHCDHIVPVIEGGGECGLENLRTLCIPCHRVQTGLLRTRLASKPRKASK